MKERMKEVWEKIMFITCVSLIVMCMVLAASLNSEESSNSGEPTPGFHATQTFGAHEAAPIISVLNTERAANTATMAAQVTPKP